MSTKPDNVIKPDIKRKRGSRWAELAAYPGEMMHDEEARRAWRFLLPRLKRLGIIEEAEGIDSMALVIFCREWALYCALSTDLEENGQDYETTGDNGQPVMKQRPAAVLQDRAFKRVKAMLTELGMSPASRRRLALEEEAKEDPLAKFLRG